MGSTGVTVACFVLSYVVVLLLELSRWGFRMPFRFLALLVMTALGVLTHTLYLWDQLAQEYNALGPQLLFSSWYDWSLLSAWALGVVYLVLIVRKPETPLGTFIVPLLLGLLGIARLVRTQPRFDRATSTGIWNWSHGMSLMIGMMLVTLGMAMALMYLLQAWRLKHKKSRLGLLRLPSLEYLQAMGRYTLFASATALGIGLLSGVIMNLQRNNHVVWTESGILLSGGLFLWLSLACLLQWRFAERGLGKWTAYLNIGSFALTLLAMAFVMAAPHGRKPVDPIMVTPGKEGPKP